MAVHYSHTQQGRAVLMIVGALFFAIFIIVVVALTAAESPVPLYAWSTVIISLVIPAVAVWIFSRMTVEVDDASVRWHFGRGMPRFFLSLSEVRDARVVSNPWYYGGIGIHLTPLGWVYNVAGGRAVELTKTDGRRLRLGTDDADALLAAIDSARRG